MPSVDGLVSGIDTESIIKGLLQVKQRQIDRLTLQTSEAKAKQASIKSLEAKIAGLRSQVIKLTRPTSSPFSTRKTTVSDENALIATSTSKAAVGVYDVRVNTLAQAHQVATQAYADKDAEITQGTFTVRAGSQSPIELTIDSANNTLQGLADSINNANAGVSATLVRDGGSGYRLLLTSQKTGAAEAISITNNLADSGGGALRPEFDLNNPVQEGLDASVTLGSGAGAITVSSPTNEISDLIEGVKLNLLQADAAKVLKVRVERDASSATNAVQDFVDSFNDVMTFIDAQVKYDSKTDRGGVLLGNRTVIEIQDKLRSSILDVVPGANPRLNRLTSLGITVGDDGKLVLNETKLQDILNGKVAGVSETDVRKLFALDGTSTNNGVNFLLGGTKTKDSTTPYQIDITQAAERASITAGTALAGSTVIDGTNKTLELSIDNATISVTLNEGTYTTQQLADSLELLINAHQNMVGRQVRVAVDGGGLLSLTSLAYGAASKVSVTGGTSLAALGLTAGQSDVGVDVAGRYIVDGQIETATGKGRVLTGDSGNGHTDGLQVQVGLSSSQVNAGIEAQLTVTRGVAARLDQALNSLLDADKGQLHIADEGFGDTIESIQKSIDRAQSVFDQQQSLLLEKFRSLETALQKIQSQSSYLSGQLAGLASLGRVNR